MQGKKYNTPSCIDDYMSGGLKFDLISVEYQGSFKFIETNPPTKDAEKVIMKKRINDKILFLSIKVLYIFK